MRSGTPLTKTIPMESSEFGAQRLEPDWISGCNYLKTAERFVALTLVQF